MKFIKLDKFLYTKADLKSTKHYDVMREIWEHYKCPAKDDPVMVMELWEYDGEIGYNQEIEKGKRFTTISKFPVLQPKSTKKISGCFIKELR